MLSGNRGLQKHKGGSAYTCRCVASGFLSCAAANGDSRQYGGSGRYAHCDGIIKPVLRWRWFSFSCYVRELSWLSDLEEFRCNSQIDDTVLRSEVEDGAIRQSLDWWLT